MYLKKKMLTCSLSWETTEQLKYKSINEHSFCTSMVFVYTSIKHNTYVILIYNIMYKANYYYYYHYNTVYKLTHVIIPFPNDRIPCYGYTHVVEYTTARTKHEITYFTVIYVIRWMRYYNILTNLRENRIDGGGWFCIGTAISRPGNIYIYKHIWTYFIIAEHSKQKRIHLINVYRDAAVSR